MIMNNIEKLRDLDISGKRVLIREDLNVPLDEEGRIVSDARLRPVLPTLRYALQQGAAVLVMAHLGRPKEGQWCKEDSLAAVATYLSQHLGQDVPLCCDYLNGVEVAPGKCLLLENVRFNVGEKANDEALSRQLAALCDVFVMDAFGVAHRAQASTHGVARFAPQVCAGPLLEQELDQLDKVLDHPALPMLAIVGGAKVSTKLGVLSRLMHLADHLIVGGGIANTLLAARGISIGASLYEPDLLDEARTLLDLAAERKINLPLPVDAVVAKDMQEGSAHRVVPIDKIAENEKILDIGPQTVTLYSDIIARMSNIVWNGPLGVFELPAFAEGTRRIGQAIAASDAYSLVGGGDTLAAIERFGLEQQFSSVSTGGGSMLEYIEGKPLPSIVMLQERFRASRQKA